ncbi:MAG: hypothetical protein AAF696_36320 [Bacteroidota bacterium]
MKSQIKRKLFGLTRKELIKLCNEKLVCAARDLAEFTKNGINANFIVALAHKCELYESSLEQESPTQHAADSKRIEQEIKDSIGAICELGKKIWSDNPSKYQDYNLALSSRTQAKPGSAK